MKSHRIPALFLMTLFLCVPSVARADLLVSTFTSDVVLRYSESTGAFLGIFASGHGLNGPSGLAYGPDGNLYVGSEHSHSVLRFNGKTGAFIDTFVPFESGGLREPEGIAFRPNGNLLVSTLSSVLEYDGTTGAFLGRFARNLGGAQKLGHPEGLEFGPVTGRLYVASSDNDRVNRYSGLTGAFIDVPVPTGSGGLNDPQGLRFGPDGNLYVSSLATNKVLEYHWTGKFLGTFASDPLLRGPEGLEFGPDGDLYVASRYSDKILRFDGATGDLVDVFDEARRADGTRLLKLPTYMTFMPDGDAFALGASTSGAAVAGVSQVPEPSVVLLLITGLVLIVRFVVRGAGSPGVQRSGG